MSVVVQHQAVEVAKAALALEESTGNLKQAKEDYRKYEKDLKSLKGTLDQLEAEYANGQPGVTQADLVELKQLIDDAEGDKEWYLAGIAAAAADVTSKTTLLVQQSSAAAQSAGTYGFNAGVQLDIDASKTQSESHQTSSVASQLSGQNIRIKTGSGDSGETTGNTLIQGSHLQADNQIAIDTGNLAITASQDTAQSSTENQHGHISVQQTFYGATGGPAVNASMDRSQSRDRQTSYNNSTLNADNIRLTTSGDAELTGANVHANSQLDVAVQGDLLLESQQNRASGSNSSAGISGGFGTSGGKDSSVTSVNGGANSGSGRYQSKETVLTSLTSGGQANINVGGHTQITGALVATVDEEGRDLGNLNLSTGTLDYADLSNTNYQSQQSAGISTSVGFAGANPADSSQQNAQDASGNDDLKLNTSNVQYSNESHYDKSKTLATVGQGNVTVRDEDSEKNGDLAGLNRDVENTEKELFEIDRQEGNVDVTVDHNMEESLDKLGQLASAAWGNLKAQGVNPEDIDPALRGQVGEELALDIAKNYVSHGGSVEDAEQVMAQYGTLLGNVRELADLYSGLDPNDANRSAVEQQQILDLQNQISSELGLISGANELTITGRERTPGEEFLGVMGQVKDYMDGLPQEEAQILGVGIQAAMGPGKAVVGMAGNFVVNVLAGDSIEAMKDDLGVKAAAGVSPDSEGLVRSEHESAQLAGESGDLTVEGAKFVIDLVAGVGLPGRKAGDGQSHNNGSGDGRNSESNSSGNSGAHAGGADSEAGLPYGGYDPRTSSINYDEISTAKPHQATAPRDLSEQAVWSQVKNDPASGKVLELSNDARFPKEAGWSKRQMTHELPDGSNITVHYQYNSNTGKAYDMKFTTPQPNVLQPGPTFQD